MRHFKFKLKFAGTGLLLSLCCSVQVLADDTEIYTQLPNISTIKPNVLFILDNSGSMMNLVPLNSSDPFLKEQFLVTNTYSGGCFDPTQVYYTTTGAQPACGSTDSFSLSDLHCGHANDEYNSSGSLVSSLGPLEQWGSYADQLAQHSVTDVWGKISVNNRAVECAQDQGIHGENTTPSSNTYIANIAAGWQSSATTPPVWSAGNNTYTLYHGNYLNYLTDPGVPLRTTRPTRFQEVIRAITALVDTNTSINIGLLAFDEYNGASFPLTGTDKIDGGEVVFPMEDVNSGRTAFKSALGGINANTSTPLSETYYEALRYYGGLSPDYGVDSLPPSVAASISGGNYISPITNECQKNSIIVLTDGTPQRDNLTTADLADLPGFIDTSSCSSTLNDPPVTANCMDDMAAWAADVNNDVLAGTGPGQVGKQHITTHTVGFAEPALSAPGSLIVATAAAGNGRFIATDNADTLRGAISEVFSKVLDVSTTFSSPAVSVNAFNRSTHLEDLYFTLFKPAGGPHWPGNLKKYKLAFRVDPVSKERVPFIADATSTAVTPVEAVDPTTGFFSTTARSFWSDTVDADDIVVGGAAGELGNLTSPRNVYTYTGAYTDNNGVFVPDVSSDDLADSDNAVDKANAAITDVMLDIVGLPPVTLPPVSGSDPRIETLLDWASGMDALDVDKDSDTTEARLDMGDPLHSQPALVQYGGTAAAPDLVAYIATNDGYLHAIDADDGREIFSFIPQELLANLNTIMDDSAGGKVYGLDGDVVAWINDANADGTISGGSEHVYLYISMRRGGNNIYSIDVTDRNNPKLRWVIKGGTGDYTELSQTWSTINIEKVKHGSAEKTVLIFAGGYDENQDNTSVRTADAVGRAVYIADAETGALLWSAGPGGDLALSEMEYSIPARVKPLDLSGDGFIDRLYVADMGGQIFRFDIDNDNNSLLASSVTGGRIADLADTGPTDARRFYYPPDVALVAEDGKAPYLAVAITSGYRAHPNEITVHDRIYLVKDKDVYNTPSPYVTLTESDLYDATLNLVGGEGNASQNQAAKTALDNTDGWFISLDDGTNTNTWIGEKGLSEVLILEGVIIATTFTPLNTTSSSNSCKPQSGTGRAFSVDLIDGSAAFPSNSDLRVDRVEKLSKEGIPPSPNVIITPGGVPTLCIGTECKAASLSKGVRKTFWYEVEK